MKIKKMTAAVALTLAMILIFSACTPVNKIESAKDTPVPEVTQEEPAAAEQLPSTTETAPADEKYPFAAIAAPKVSSINNGVGIRVKWEATEGAKIYSVYSRTSENEKWKSIMHTEETELIVRKDIQKGTEYFFMVRCLNDGENAALSPVGESTSIAIYDAPGAPTLNVVSDGIEVNWNAVPGAGQYSVYMKTSESDSWKSVKHTSDTSLTVKKDLAAGNTYYFMVRCLNSDGTSVASPLGETATVYYG